MTNVNNGPQASPQPTTPALPPAANPIHVPAGAVPPASPIPQISIQNLTNAITAANTAYVSSRQNAATAAATVFYVWTHTCSNSALEPNKAWYEAELAKLKAAIEDHNKALDQAKKAEEKKLADEKKAYKEQNGRPNSDESKQKYQAGLDKLSKDSADRKKALTEQRMVKVEARSDAAPFTEITKFVLKLNRSTQNSQVNRFAKVVGWLNRHVSMPNTLSIPQMAELILDNGGFDAAYESQRAHDLSNDLGSTKATATTEVKTEDKASNDAVLEHFRKVTAEIPGVMVADLDATRSANGLVTLIARKEENGLTIISQLAVPTEEVLRLCVDYKDDKLLPGDAGVEFVATALTAGELVEEGSRSKDGDTVKIQRTFSLINVEADPKLMVSAQGSDLSVVIHAMPKGPVMDLFAKPGHWVLDAATDGKHLQECVADAAARKMVTMAVDTQEREVGEDLLQSSMGWVTTNGPLQTKGDPNAIHIHSWLPMSPIGQTPVDVDSFSPAGTLTVSRSGLDTLTKGHIGKWASVKADSKVANKAKNTVKVKFSKSKITVCTNAGDDVALCSGNMKQATTLYFRPRTLSKLLTKLSTLNVREITFAPDDRGALQVAFEDERGCYAIYVPTCKEDGTPLTARFASIRVPHDEA